MCADPFTPGLFAQRNSIAYMAAVETATHFYIGKWNKSRSDRTQRIVTTKWNYEMAPFEVITKGWHQELATTESSPRFGTK